jgi:hypothetical protein
MTHHGKRARAVSLLFAFGSTGCGLFIHGKTPIGGVPEADREQIEAGLNEPDQVRLTKPTKIAGVELAAGSTIKRDGETSYRLVSAAQTSVSGVIVPAGTEIELVKANSIITGETYNWNGVVHVGAQATYSGHAVAPRDRVVFAGNLLSAPSIMQIQLAETRAVNGKEYPAGTLIDIDANGKITGAYTPEAQRALGQAREQWRKERVQREQDCKLRCAGVTDVHAHARCMGQCR